MGATNEDHRDSLNGVEGKPTKLPYPKSVFFILSNEFCERFNYYGMRTILVLYFTKRLMFDEDTATVLFHASTTLVYFMCIFGAILSDSFLGKFRTILYLSLVYALGSTIIALGAIPLLNLPAIATTLTGLGLIAIGSGGIKPCVAAFGGDQFKLPEQVKQMATFFSVFYFSINAGSLISTFLTPILREDVHCFGDNHCYSLAFGVPGALMILSVILFVSGKSLYKINPPAGNMVTRVTMCISNAIATRFRTRKTHPREHWLDYAEPKYGAQLVADTKILLRILVLYIPLPLFWALFDQQGSRWTIQAMRMSGDIGFYDIKPDQMQVVNPLLVLTFIPVFEAVIYPLISKIGIRRPLQKLTVGGFLAAIAFLLSGLVELELEKTYPVVPSNGEAQLRFINGLPCDFTGTAANFSSEKFILNQFSLFEEKHLNIDGKNPRKIEYVLESNGTGCPRQIKGQVDLHNGQDITTFVSGPAIKIEDVYEDDVRKAQSPMLRILFVLLENSPLRNVTILTPSNGNHVEFDGNSTNRELFEIEAGEHEVHIAGKSYTKILLKPGSVSALVVLETTNAEHPFELNLVEITEPNSMNMLWLLPQYIVMTLAEVMFSVTGLEFSYSQAPASMKSVLQACWLLTVALGNVIVTIIAGAKIFDSQANEFFLFTGMMVVDLLVFMLLAKAYKGSVPANTNSEADINDTITTTNVDDSTNDIHTKE